MPMIQFHYAPSSLSIANTGHTVKTYYDKGSYIEVAGKRYYLIEFHFHTPAEEAIDGKRADMDMHLVHQSSDGKFAVVGVMFRAGAHNPGLNPIWRHLPPAPSPKQNYPEVMVSAAALIPANHAYYNYAGSLTTPPCTQGINWFVLKQPVSADAAPLNARKVPASRQ